METLNPAVVEDTISSPSPAKPAADSLRDIGYYRRALSDVVGPELLKPNHKRLFWITLNGVGSVLFFFLIGHFHWAWYYKLLCGIMLGLCNGSLAFLCHELLHGSIIKSQKVQDVIAFFGTMPFVISPTFWKYWHNRLHHGKTQQLIKDPDAFPTLRIYQNSRFMRWLFPFTPGSGHKRSFFYFLFGFSLQNITAQFYLRFRNKIFDGLDQKRVTYECAAQLVVIITLLIWVGFSNWFWVLIVPLAVQNYLLTSYIATNHNLNPLTAKNDPLANSLSVTNFRIFEFFNFNFGYHVEHHIFPTMSAVHAKKIHRELLKRFPTRYHVMPKWKAIKALYSTSRIYKNSQTLIHPENFKIFRTLQERDAQQ